MVKGRLSRYMGIKIGDESEEIVSEKQNRMDILEVMRKPNLWLMYDGVERELLRNLVVINMDDSVIENNDKDWGKKL